MTERCREHLQGDRCRLDPAAHVRDAQGAIVHVGSFHTWTAASQKDGFKPTFAAERRAERQVAIFLARKHRPEDLPALRQVEALLKRVAGIPEIA